MKNVLKMAVFILCVTFCYPSETLANSGLALFEKPFSSRVDSEGKQSFILNKKAMSTLATQQVNTLLILVAGLERTYKKKRQLFHGNGLVTWVGKVSSGNGEIVITFGSDHLYAQAVVDGKTVVYSPDGRKFGIVSQVLDPNFAVHGSNDMAIVPQEEQLGSSLRKNVVSNTSQGGTTDDGSLIDIMVVYTQGFAAKYPGTVQTKLQNLIDFSNNAFDNSKINTQFRLVHSQQVSYSDSSSIKQALNDVTNNSGVFASVESLRDTYGADQVTLVRAFTPSIVTDGVCGLAWLKNDSTTARKAYTVSHIGGYYQGYYCSDNTFVHEIGHNLGCAHDHANLFGTTGIYTDSYGYQFAPYYTIMAYPNNCHGCTTQIPYFSNPDISYQGNPTGVLNSANNTRTINLTRVIMAGYRTTKVPIQDISTPNIIPIMNFLLSGSN